MYEFESRIRYSEVGLDQKLRYTALMNYLQDCSTFQSEDLGIGLEYLYNFDLAWVVNSWQIDIIRLPKLGDRVIIGTLPYKLKGFIGYRNFYMKDAESGEYLAKANSVWTLINLKDVKPVKATQEMIDAYVLSEPIDMEYLDRKITLTGKENRMEPISVTRDNLDSNNHVNNEQYIQIAMRYLPEGYKINRLLVEYKKSAYLGDSFYPVLIENDDYIGVSLDDSDGDTFVKVRFS
ncbi:MAG: thioesterase [Lachnospiraceae bacterium]|nr:thioesterase [Lachnospiraceae bacterium]